MDTHIPLQKDLKAANDSACPLRRANFLKEMLPLRYVFGHWALACGRPQY